MNSYEIIELFIEMNCSFESRRDNSLKSKIYFTLLILLQIILQIHYVFIAISLQINKNVVFGFQCLVNDLMHTKVRIISKVSLMLKNCSETLKYSIFSLSSKLLFIILFSLHSILERVRLLILR